MQNWQMCLPFCFVLFVSLLLFLRIGRCWLVLTTSLKTRVLSLFFIAALWMRMLIRANPCSDPSALCAACQEWSEDSYCWSPPWWSLGPERSRGRICHSPTWRFACSMLSFDHLELLTEREERRSMCLTAASQTGAGSRKAAVKTNASHCRHNLLSISWL